MQATLSAYNPSWRDRLAQWMVGQSAPTPERRNFVEGLLGSSGLGSTGAGVVDATPLGGLLGAQESAQAGDYKGMALAALPMPAAKARGIIAYHGSPHSFDRFDLSKIGTGEGAQAYGHGLYFADKEEVAKQYREFLSSRNNDLTDPGNLAASLLYRTPEGTREAAIREAQTVINSIDRMPAAYKHDPGVKERTQKALELLQSGAELPKQGGSMYQVRINADPEHFLDWDKPLSEQPKVVEQLVGGAKHPEDWVPDASVTGSKYWAETQGGPSDRREFMMSRGVPGIKYLDAGSRGAGDGSRNYVVFDDRLVDILKKYGIVGLLGGGAAMGADTQGQEAFGM